MLKIHRKNSERFGLYARIALTALGKATAACTLAGFSGLEAVVENFTIYNRYSRQYIGRRRSYSRRSMYATLGRLKERGYVQVVARGDEVFIQLTKDGKRVLERLRMTDLKIAAPKVWDRMWRLVGFDIPEKRRTAREIFRNRLCQLGFVKLEKSLFVLPYPCEKEVAFLAKSLDIGPYVHCITAVSFNGDHRLRTQYVLR